MENLQLRHALLLGFTEPSLLLKKVWRERIRIRHPSIPLTEKADEKGAAGADFIEAQFQCLLPLTLLLRDSPAQVHLHQFHMPLSANAAELWPSLVHQFIAILHHVFEC